MLTLHGGAEIVMRRAVQVGCVWGMEELAMDGLCDLVKKTVGEVERFKGGRGREGGKRKIWEKCHFGPYDRVVTCRPRGAR